MIKLVKIAIALLFTITPILLSAQQNEGLKKIKITGKIVDKTTGQPLEYTTISFQNKATTKITAGGITNDKGEFSIDVAPATYTVKIEFISFKPLELKEKILTDNTNLGTIKLENDATQLQAVVIKSEKSSVEIKLDKKVYNIGKDLAVKGGTVTDVLENIPSITVDSDGNVSLRGNDNVKILIDGRPSNAISVADALRMIPADAVDKVEVVTNPSARYDAEGGAGILNIVLKKGKTNGTNGTIMATAGEPANHGLNGTLNYKTDDFNIFTTQGFNYRNNPGQAQINSRYLNDDNSTQSFIDESRKSKKISRTYNGSFGLDWYLDKTLTWTNSINYRKSTGDNNEDVNYLNFDANKNYTSTRFRNNQSDTKSENVEYTSSFVKKFNNDGHQLSIDGNFSKNQDDDLSTIANTSTTSSTSSFDNSSNIQTQYRNLVQTDYVLPIGLNGRFEAGYRGSFTNSTTNYMVANNGITNPFYTNILEYKEKVNAAYTQFGSKYKKISVFAGLRFEDSNIDVNQLTTYQNKNKRYNNFFPSATLGYDFSDSDNISLNYSKRINRPRGRQLNPFSSISSDINVFEGNPDLNPSLTDAFEIGYLKKMNKITLNSSLYYNATKNNFQMIRKENGNFVGLIPVMITTPINLSNEYRFGLDVSLNYSPYKWWKLNSGINYYNIKTVGKYTYTNYLNQEITQDFGVKTNTWNGKLSSKITLPYKIDWQTNINYEAPIKTAQGGVRDQFSMNLGFSKDVFKEKATLALNANDVFNSRKRRMDTYIPGQIDSYSQMQFRKRQITLSFTYRFNKSKSDKEKEPKPKQNEGGDDIQG